MASKVFVGNLSYKTTKEEIENLFSQVGPTRDVFLPTERETGRMRGFAFVEFESEEAAAQAIEKFNGYELGGRALRVNAAEERRNEGGFRRGGEGGFGGYGGGYGGDSGGGGGRDFGGGKAKGSRRNIRAKKRGL